MKSTRSTPRAERREQGESATNRRSSARAASARRRAGGRERGAHGLDVGRDRVRAQVREPRGPARRRRRRARGERGRGRGRRRRAALVEQQHAELLQRASQPDGGARGAARRSRGHPAGRAGTAASTRLAASAPVGGTAGGCSPPSAGRLAHEELDRLAAVGLGVVELHVEPVLALDDAARQNGRPPRRWRSARGRYGASARSTSPCLRCATLFAPASAVPRAARLSKQRTRMVFGGGWAERERPGTTVESHPRSEQVR